MTDSLTAVYCLVDLNDLTMAYEDGYTIRVNLKLMFDQDFQAEVWLKS